MISYIYISLIGLSVLVIIFVLLRKFPIIANLDLENLPEEQEVKKKKSIIEKRLTDKGAFAQKQIKEKLSPLGRVWRVFQLKFRIYVGKIERLLHYEELLKNRARYKVTNLVEKEKDLNELINKAEAMFREQNFEKAEELFIAAIKIDKKSISAYRGLADTYLAKSAFDEAFQTYDFLAKLTPNDDALMVKLSELYDEKGRINEAINYLERATTINDSLSSRFHRLAELYTKANQPELALDAIIQASELEPKNPKYLDFLIENAIICGKRELASKSYEELRIVNPENHKLLELKEKIDKLPL